MLNYNKMLTSNNILQSEKIIVSIDSIIVGYENNSLLLSVDGGKTYCKRLDITGVNEIDYIHVFKDTYDLLLCTAQKAYYSSDWINLNESTVLGIDRNTFAPTTYDNFLITAKMSEIAIIDGQEILCWGNYSTDAATEYLNINIWYTVDKGRTIKSCFKFGMSIPNGQIEPLLARHVHNVNFNPTDNTFWCQTGDEPTTTYSHWLKGTYNTATDMWTWILVGSGNHFKTGNMEFYGGYAYVSWDIPNGGVKKCLYSDMGNTANHQQILITPNDCGAILIGKRGDMLALIGKYGGDEIARMLFYSTDGVNFHQIIGEVPETMNSYGTFYVGYWRPNRQGKILTAYADEKEDPKDWEPIPSVWLDDIIKRAGFPDAFKPLS